MACSLRKWGLRLIDVIPYEVLAGIRSYLPQLQKNPKVVLGGGNSESARYCYSVWLRHLKCGVENSGMKFPFSSLAEIGPGNSLGIGLAALLSGVQSYHAFEIEKYPIQATNLQVFEELVQLFKSRAHIPGPDEFPEVKPYISNYDFPHGILSEDLLNESLREDRLQRIREALRASTTDEVGSMVRLEVPWNQSSKVRAQAMDMIISQAVLEHVDELSSAYAIMAEWLAKDGIMSHQVDFRCHGVAKHWNGQWTIPAWLWKIVRGRRKFLINRQPVSVHRRLLQENGMKITFEKPVEMASPFAASQLAAEFRQLSDVDRTTSGILLQAVKLR